MEYKNQAMLFFMIAFSFMAKITDATVSCAVCDSIRVNLTTDTALNTDGCTIQEKEVCTLILRADYVGLNNSFAYADGSSEAALVLTNGEPQMTDVTSIWFDEFKVQRTVNILCFAGTSCGLDLLKSTYKDQVLPFDYATTQRSLSNYLYSSTAVPGALRCTDSTGGTVACANGFCRSIFNGNGLISYSSCVNKGLVPNPYGLTIARTVITDFGGDQTSIIYTCNTPGCSSQQSINQVLQQLIDAKLLPQPGMSTATPSQQTSMSPNTPSQQTSMSPNTPSQQTSIPTTSRTSDVSSIFNHQMKFVVSFFALLSMIAFVNH